ncbi:DUF4845 domain-containing protein [Methylophilus aquaticus]|uniref:DUF4845 domain-containing protein n=1 Tax=Methylophilus aquaticus TaxID=1971610 RepID=A0ABT9JU02_9PROT|nr:DUF4845 domain-containing protein [Methylophilus aquaticus]MDP8568011.1 DUF4845 domain-containing protein [Methylophilus aquaticus]
MKQNTGNIRSQSGIGLLGILLVLTAFGILGGVALKALPSYIEFYTIQSTVKRIANDPLLQSDAQRREAFDHQMHVEMINDIKGRDLVIGSGGVAVQYQKKIPLTDTIGLVIDFNATSEE